MKKKEIIFILILALTLFGLYWKTFNYELIWDSKIFFKQNISLIENRPLWSAFELGYFRQKLAARSSYYRPIVVASFMIEEKLWGLKNVTLRLINLLIYISALIFLYVFFKYQSEQKYFPETAILLYAFYPLNLDNIVWVVGRCDLLLLLWASLTFLFLGFFIKKGKYYFLVCSSFFYLLGILSKEAFLFFLPVLILYELIKRKKIVIPYHLSNILLTLLFFVLKVNLLGIKNLRLIFHSSIIENIKTLIVPLGFYFRSIIFPFYYDMFLPLWDINNLLYMGIGILFILVIFYLLYESIKDKKIAIPLSLVLTFLCGHLLLTFTLIFPFKIYTRYMMIPSLGFVWILTKYLSQIKEKIRLTLVLILLLLFIPSIVINTYSYKTELSFFQRAKKSSPKNSFILYSIADIYYVKQDYLLTELFLNKALSLKMQKQTAMLIALRYAEIEFLRANYNSVLKWIDSLTAFQTASTQIGPYIESQCFHQKALVNMARGEVELAESLFKRNINKFEEKEESYRELYTMYIGHNMWKKAKNLEKSMKSRFPFAREIDTAQIKKEFETLSSEEKIRFYILHKNFHKAIEIIKEMSLIDLDLKILLTKLYYQAGKKEEGKKTVNEILAEYSDDFTVLNTIGNVYLNDLIRVKEALFYFKKSLDINKNQPELARSVDYLTYEYLNKLQKVWD